MRLFIFFIMGNNRQWFNFRWRYWFYINACNSKFN